ncbi:hypothetical protein KI440_00410 [Candidatus Saccharibacteria bacterium TM7i]|nr:hypothetical protein KI440_00410 [Candidatus Saccharibacteria bacterium TM7i]
MDEDKTTKDEEVKEAPSSATPDESSSSNLEGGNLDEDESSPADALSRTPEDLDAEKAEQDAAEGKTPTEVPVKKVSPIKRFLRKINVYFLFFALLLIVAGAITVVNYINNQKANPKIDIATQELAEKTLEQLANTDVSVGNNSQTLTIQGNAIIAGQTLMRGSANIAGNLQVGGSIQGPSITISGAANLGQTQTQTLQVQNTLAVQGGTTLRDLNVSGATTFSGAVTANQLTVTNLILSGNAKLEVPNHIGFTGPTPGRGAINNSVLGSGGSLSISGSDTSGTINIQTGNGPTPGCFGQVNFNRPFDRQPRVIVSPVGQAAGQTQYYVTRTNANFSICTANAAPANQTFSFDYFVAN